MPIRNLLCVDESSMTTIIPDCTTPGKHRFNYALEQFSADVGANIDPNNKILVGCESIPKMDAYVELFFIDMQEHRYGSNAIRAWQGIHSMIALSRIMGFNLSETTIDINGNNTLVTKVYTNVLADCLTGTNITLLQKDGKAVAFFHNKLGWLPLANMPTDVMTDVPWYDASTKTWKDILSIKDDPRMQEMYYKRLAAWLDQFVASGYVLPSVATMVQDLSNRTKAPFAGMPMPQGANGSPYGGNAPVGIYDIKSAIMNVPVLAVDPMADGQFFADTLLITGANSVGRLPVSFSTSFTVNNDRFCALLPISRDGVKYLLDNKDSVKLESVVLNTSNFSINSTINVQIKLRIDGVERTYMKDYSVNNIIYRAMSFPQMSLWPDVKFDHNGANIWNNYYVTFSEGLGMVNARPSPYMQQLPDNQDGQYVLDMDGMEDSVKDIFSVNRDKQWKLAMFKDYPEFMHMKYTLNGQEYDIGCIYIEPPKNVITVGGDTATATIDFGTTNSVCAFALGETESSNQPLFDEKDVLVLQTICDGDPNVAPNRGANDDFHSYYWFSTKKSAVTTDDGKIRSIAQYYSTDTNDNTIPLQAGRAILADGNIISHFETLAEGKALQEVGIYGNMKFAPAGTPQGHAAELFVTHLSMNAALLALKRGAGKLSLIYSYPDLTSLRFQTAYWRKAVKTVSAAVSIPGFLNEPNGYATMPESEAAARYVTHAGGNLQANVGYSVVDIGGGTSDMSLWKSDDGGKKTVMLESYSLHFAGNNIISNSVFKVLRTFHNSAGAIWNASSSTMKNVFEQLVSENSALMRYVGTDIRQLTVPQFNELLNSIATSVNGVLDVAPFRNFDASEVMVNPWGPEQMFISMVRTKVCGIFYILSQMINNLPENQRPEFKGHAVYNISLAGGGSRALNICGDGFTNEFIEKMLIANELNPESDNSSVSVSVQMPLRPNKVEVTKGMLYNKIIRDGVEYDIPAPPEAGVLGADVSDNELNERVRKAYSDFVNNYLDSSDESIPGLKIYWFPYGEDGSVAKALNEKSEQELSTAINRTLTEMRTSGEMNDCRPELLPHVAALKTLENMMTLYL